VTAALLRNARRSVASSDRLPVRLSIITPSLNAERFIAQAVESVGTGSGNDIEHIVVDGGSSDGTLGTLRRYPHLRVLVRPGLGLYPALDLGIAEATGDIIGLLNADDRYLPGALEPALAALAAPDIDCAAGGARVVRQGDDDRPELVQAYDDAGHKLLAWDPLLYGAPLINARLYRKSFMARIGGFDARHTIAADREWLIRAKLAGMRIAAIGMALYEYREHVGSLTINRARVNADRIGNQHLAIAAQYIDDPRTADVMRCWHAWETGRKALRSLAGGDAAAAGHAARQGFTENPLWPLRFLAAVPARVAARLAR
jgi:glycosyltransferase involved in cell wall biosynthesis